MRIDLNADVGEGYDDEPLLALVTSVNVACGAHAGDPATMARIVGAARRIGVAIGAHPGYPDREGFGRRPLDLPTGEIESLVAEQILALSAIAADAGARVGHVKPHGALYNQAAVDESLSRAIAAGVRAANPGLRLVGLAGSVTLEAGAAAGLRTAREAFADRRYLADGTLAPRATPEAVITDPQTAAEQAVRIARGEEIDTLDGARIRIAADTIGLHGDTPGALGNAAAVRARLSEEGVELGPLD